MTPEQILCLQAATQIYRQCLNQTIALYLAGQIPSQPTKQEKAAARQANAAKAKRRVTF